jgi:uncharacterized metal-binding protein YceD (DUF177 family)
MDTLKEYNIYLKSLKTGTYHFDYEIDWEFFRHYESSLIKQGRFKVDLELEFRSKLMDLNFTVSGVLDTNCDRCTADISLPIQGEYRLLVKFEPDKKYEAEVIYLSPETQVLNVAQYIYECIALAVPFKKVYDCESEIPRPCDMTIVGKLENPETEKEEQSVNPTWDLLKKMIKN